MRKKMGIACLCVILIVGAILMMNRSISIPQNAVAAISIWGVAPENILIDEPSDICKIVDCINDAHFLLSPWGEREIAAPGAINLGLTFTLVSGEYISLSLPYCRKDGSVYKMTGNDWKKVQLLIAGLTENAQ